MEKYIDKLIGILKRLLNVISIGAFLLLVIYVLLGFSEGFRQHDTTKLIGNCFWTLISIAVVNYIVFKKITLWHKNIKE